MASIPVPPHGIQEVVKALVREHHSSDRGDEHPQDPPTANHTILNDSNPSSPPSSPQKPQSPRLAALQNLRFNAGTPSERTGPPRSISYNYSVSGSHPASRANSHDEREGYPSIHLPASDSEQEPEFEDPDQIVDFVPTKSPFRGALEYQNAEQKEKERELLEKRQRQKRRDSYFHDVFKPARWLESPKEVHTPFIGAESERDEVASQRPQSHRHLRRGTMQSPTLSTASSRFPPPRRTRSLEFPKAQGDESTKSPTVPKWNRLRSLIPHIVQTREHAPPQASEVVPQAVNITDELITGGLSTLMLRLWFERDEKGHRRIPILFHRLRIRVSDSLHPLHGHKAVFRIECEYANGAARWVVYRQLREFLSLHTHYTISNAYNRNVDKLPDFPRAGIPYFNFLKERGSDFSRADFARLQRESLENYLIGLIRAVMFHPAANRLAGFLEVSALSIALAQSGGTQYKAGFMRIEAVGNKGTFGKRATTWKEKKMQRWCAVRESYMVVVEEMGETAVYDVFLVDPDFKIERPTRAYRQGLNLITHPETAAPNEKSEKPEEQTDDANSLRPSAKGCGSVRSRLSRAFNFSGQHEPSERGTSPPRTSRARGSSVSAPLSGETSDGAELARQITPMLDPSTNTNPLIGGDDHRNPLSNKKKKSKPSDVSKHTFYIENSQTRLKLFARNERQMLQFIAALEKVARESHFVGKNRFDSFAPIRLNVAAQWLVDGRDYFWNLSRAILLAKESIYIHDWWLSPELQLRRPGMEKYRLDHLLERKAKQGVKIYVILYLEVSSKTTPTDSNYAKQRLSALHPNIMVQRSPSHFQTGTFYWAHHEKLCVIDQAIAFMGGLDLCFGRWDTAQHVLTDDPDQRDEAIWQGKDYSNPRILDFHALNKPEDDMYDRSKVPRMPWHDVGVQIVGQPARDLARHFVQRWNYLLRIKNHSRPMPSLLPPPEFKPGELTALGLTGTCELQICRSAGPWSMGTPDRIEHSIQNAYLKAIQMSEHFVYIENQFFITSTVVNESKIENKIGDAIVHRILRAHREGTPFKCCIVIPSLPGFTFPVDHSDASAIRIIIECQNRTICRGPNSIFARLRKEGIDPDDYISVFSLRNWAKLRGDVLTSEQVYIHAKVCIVDDRLAIIGSANINERSQRGDRDSEIAAVIRDTDMIDCTMAGKPFKVGRFAHTLRVRLMREHLGVDVDAMYEEDLMAAEPVHRLDDIEEWDPDEQQEYGKEKGVTYIGKGHRRSAMGSLVHDTMGGIGQAIYGAGEVEGRGTARLMRKMGITSEGLDANVTNKTLHEERQTFTREGEEQPGFTSSVVPTLEEKFLAEQELQEQPQQVYANGNARTSSSSSRVSMGNGNDSAWLPNGPSGNGNGNGDVKPQQAPTPSHSRPPSEAKADGELFGTPAHADTQHDDKVPGLAAADADSEEEKAPGARATIRRHMNAKPGSKAWTLPTPTPHVDPHGFEDPICDEFWKKVWVACAVHNTEIFRKVFHAVPDDMITTWKQYKEFIVHHERLNKPAKDQANPEPVGRVPSETGDVGVPGGQPQGSQDSVTAIDEPVNKPKDFVENTSNGDVSHTPTQNVPLGAEKDTRTRKTSRALEPFDQADREEMEKLLEELRGHLVLYPTRFLEGEDIANNFLFNADRLLPLPIYN